MSALFFIILNLYASKGNLFYVILRYFRHFQKNYITMCTLSCPLLSFVLPGSSRFSHLSCHLFFPPCFSCLGFSVNEVTKEIIVTAVWGDESVCFKDFCYQWFLWKSLKFHVEIVIAKQSLNFKWEIQVCSIIKCVNRSIFWSCFCSTTVSKWV